MEFRSWKGFCLCDLGGGFPPEAQSGVAARDAAPAMNDFRVTCLILSCLLMSLQKEGIRPRRAPGRR